MMFFIGTEILQLSNKFLLIVGVRYTEVNFNTKLPLAPKRGVRYRKVSAISVAVKRIFYVTMTLIPPVLVISVSYRKMAALKHVREVPL